MYDLTQVNRPLHNSTHQNIRWVAFVTLIISFNRLLMTLFIVCNWRIMSNIVIFNLSSIAWQINITVNNERFMKSLTLGINECFHDASPSCVYMGEITTTPYSHLMLVINSSTNMVLYIFLNKVRVNYLLIKELLEK